MTPEERTAYGEALRRIEAVFKRRDESLDLTGLGLTHLPPKIGQLAGLTSLDLSRNQLSAIPPEIGQLARLTSLHLGSNRLSALPSEMGQLARLTSLDLNFNQLSALPSELGQLTALTSLHVSHNKLRALPSRIGQLAGLTLLDLSANQLTALPLEIGQLAGLSWLNLSNNFLNALPPEIGQLADLTALNLSGNRLGALPLEIGQLACLTELSLQGNQLSALPPEIVQLTRLETLVLERNAIDELPEGMKALDRLKKLMLHGNAALRLPSELLGPNLAELRSVKNPPAKPADILAYYFAQREGPRRPLNEVKVLVVGESAVGKTSLIRQLRGESHNLREDKTHGIERHQLPMACGRLGEVRLNVWDFGGQDIMHATHQFFLTHRSVYLLVLDSRHNERQSRIDYWLRLIASYGGSSPVIVVCNKADQQVMQLNWTGLSRDYPQIKAYAKEVSCFHHGNEDRRKGLDELRQLIAQAVENDVTEVNQPILEKWLNLKDELEKDGRPYLTLEEYHTLAKQKGIEARRDREVLLTLMHQLGCVLHFSEHSIFERERAENAAPVHVEELNVLDPRWVTGAIYRLLNDAELIRAGGIMDRGSMRRSLAGLPGERYPSSKEDFILAMMRRFEICFAFDGDSERWLLPDLLHKDEVDTGDWAGSLSFRYQYRVLPSSVIGRLMVRLHAHIARHCLWRTGAKFARGACEALVRSEPEEARLGILIRGGTARDRREFLALFRGTLTDIHRSFSGNLGVEELVPVPGHPSIFVDYETLLLLEGDGVATHGVKVEGNLVKLVVADALNGVTERGWRYEELLRVSQKEEGSQLRPVREVAAQSRSTPELWWQSWPAISAATALGAGAVVWILLTWESTTGRIILATVVAVFFLMMSHNPALRFRRLFQWALVGWMAANALGIGIAAKWKDDNGEAVLNWDGAVSWSFNAAFAVVVVVTAFLAHKEWAGERRAE